MSLNRKCLQVVAPCGCLDHHSKDHDWAFYYAGNVRKYIHRNLGDLTTTIQQELIAQDGYSRVSVRFPFFDPKGIEGDFTDTIRNTSFRVKDGHREMVCEAIVPVKAREDLTGLAIFGWTHPKNCAPHEESEEQKKLLQRVIENGRHIGPMPIGYLMEYHTGDDFLTDNDVFRLSEIWTEALTTYPLDLSDSNVIKGLCRDNHSAIIREISSGKISAVALAETAEIRLSSGKSLAIIEISEVAAHRDHTGRSLATFLYREILQRETSAIDCILTECRANNKGILKAAWHSGMTPIGKLSGHIPIGGRCTSIRQMCRYGDLIVFVKQ